MKFKTVSDSFAISLCSAKEKGVPVDHASERTEDAQKIKGRTDVLIWMANVSC